jgi:putative peptide zinc metalloprotease protein
LGFVLFMPLPHSVNCSFELAPRDAASIYVDVRGLVDKIHVQNGRTVEAGETLVTLRNPDLELKVIELEGQLLAATERLRGLERLAYVDETAGMQIQQAREIEATIVKQLKEKREELSRLKIVTPIAGVVLPVPSRSKRNEEVRLPQWSGSPLDIKNVGAQFQESELICRVGEPEKLEAELVVDQADIDLLDQAMAGGKQPEAVLQFDAYPGQILTSRVVDIARIEMKAAPITLSNRAGGDVSTKQDQSTGQLRPLSTSYQARVPLEDQGELRGLLTIGQQGNAKVYTQWQSLGKRLYRYVARTFHFDL